MSIRDHLNLFVTITRTVTTIDAYGDPITTSSSVIIPATIWSPSQNDSRISDKIAKTSTHVLAIMSGSYQFSDQDSTATCDGITYRLVGHPDDVANRGVLVLHGMERMS